MVIPGLALWVTDGERESGCGISNEYQKFPATPRICTTGLHCSLLIFKGCLPLRYECGSVNAEGFGRRLYPQSLAKHPSL